MNPKKDDLYKGNLGRYNFEGSGPDGSFQDVRVSQVRNKYGLHASAVLLGITLVVGICIVLIFARILPFDHHTIITHPAFLHTTIGWGHCQLSRSW